MIDPNLNFCRVFELPEEYSSAYCFGGGIPTNFKMVDWFYPAGEDELDEDWETVLVPRLKEFLLQKNYTKPGRNYLLLTDWGACFTLSIRIQHPRKFA